MSRRSSYRKKRALAGLLEEREKEKEKHFEETGKVSEKGLKRRQKRPPSWKREKQHWRTTSTTGKEIGRKAEVGSPNILLRKRRRKFQASP